MYVLRVEHRVPDFNGWMEALDSDPLGRKQSGVRRYRVFRPTDDPNYVMIDLEFDTSNEAEALGGALRDLWGRVQGRLMENPRARIVETVESREY